MKNVKEISDYLGLDNSVDNRDILGTALTIEAKYEEKLESGWYGYGLLGDFETRPETLEDFTAVEKLIPVKLIDGIMVYKIIEADY